MRNKRPDCKLIVNGEVVARIMRAYDRKRRGLYVTRPGEPGLLFQVCDFRDSNREDLFLELLDELGIKFESTGGDSDARK